MPNNSESDRTANETGEEQNSEEKVPVENEESKEQDEEKVFVFGDGLSLDVSASQMKVSLELQLEYAARYTAADLEKFLGDNNIKSPISTEILQRIFDEKHFNKSIVVSKGTPVKNGEDGKVDWEVDLSILEGAKLVERGGRVDWKERHFVLPVEEGDLLARLIDPTDGESGMNVYGEELPATPGKPTKFPAGKGMRIGEDEKELYAGISGVICKEGEKITVSPVYNIAGNVDLSSGNVMFNETVTISGDVLSDFKVQAGQDIHVNGIVEGAQLNANGNIYINGGIQGDSKAHITAHGDIVVKFINNSKVVAFGDITVNGAIIQSDVQAQGTVLVESNRAVIAGGHVKAEKEVIASVIGSESGTKTVIEIGEELYRKIGQQKEEENKVELLVKNLKKLKQVTNTLNQLRDKGKLPPQQEEIRLKTIRGALQIQAKIKKKREEIKELEKQIDTTRKSQKGVSVKETAWPGTTIRIMEKIHPIKTRVTKAFFALMENEIEVFAYKEKEEKKADKKEKKKE